MRRWAARHRSMTITRTAVADHETNPIVLAALMGLAVIALCLVAMPRAAAADPAAIAPAAMAAVDLPSTTLLVAPAQRESLDDLLAVRPPDHLLRSRAEIADDSIAIAVAAGTNPDLEKVSGFRKRSTDLFRAERPVAIGEQEMLVRLRLRAKSRETMSVEVRF